MGRTKSQLFHLSKIVNWIFVEDDPSHLMEWIVTVRPDFGQIERVELTRCRLRFRHDLYVQGPRGKITPLYGVEQISCRIVGIGTGQLIGRLARQIAYALIGFEMVFDVMDITLLIDIHIGVTAVPVHVSVTIGCTPIGK
jgi:hypothetical protein